GEGVAVRGSRRHARLPQQVLVAELAAPGGQPDRDLERAALAVGFDLDRAQALERAPRDDLAARSVRAREQDQELALARPPDAVEAAQLGAQRGAHVGERLLGELLSVVAREGLEVADG